jgi:hypothetical protein
MQPSLADYDGFAFVPLGWITTAVRAERQRKLIFRLKILTNGDVPDFGVNACSGDLHAVPSRVQISDAKRISVRLDPRQLSTGTLHDDRYFARRNTSVRRWSANTENAREGPVSGADGQETNVPWIDITRTGQIRYGL